jgi:hypothetical protein
MNSLVFRALIAAFITFAIVWALVLGWWQTNDFSPSRNDLLLYLAVIPLLLVAGYWLLRGFIEHIRKPVVVEQPAAPTVPLDDDPLAPGKKVSEAAARQFTIMLVDASLETAVGQSGEDVLSAMEAGQRPEPSEHLIDADGFPAFSAEISDLQAETLAERLEESPGLSALINSPSRLRALTLLDRVAIKLEASMEVLSEIKAKPSLRIVWILPADWEREELSVLRPWLQANYWRSFTSPSPEMLLYASSGGVDAMQRLDEEIVLANRSTIDNELIVVIGAVSNIDQHIIDQWSNSGKLYGPNHQDGEIPGEGGVALLLVKRKMMESMPEASAVEITRVAMGKRDKRLDAGGRISGKLIENLFSDVLNTFAVAHEEIKSVMLDADHRSKHITEAMEGGGEALAHLEPMEDFLPSGAVTGSIGPIAPLVALACARTRVLADEGAALFLSNHAALERAALLVKPMLTQEQTESQNT